MRDVVNSNPKRRLGAVLFADVANYTGLMGQDEIGTWSAAKSRFRDFNELAKLHYGDVLEVRGDGLFVLFDSAIHAVDFGMELQKKMKILNDNMPGDRQFLFRVGINLGEILVDGTQVSGDCVNIASRLESLARPGHVCISATVYEQVRSRLTYGYEYLGAQRLKNVKEAVDAFQVHENSTSAAMTRGLRPLFLSENSIVLPAKDRSVVVLPLQFQGSDQTESWYADGLSDDITTSLSRFHDLFVIARSSAYAYNDPEVDPSNAARELGVRYVVKGSLRKAGGRIRVAIELLDAEYNRIIWGERYDRELDGIFELQDEIAQLVVSSVAQQIESSELDRLRQIAPADLRAYGFVLQGQQHIFRYTMEEVRRARALYEKALHLDPDYARALAAKSRTLNIDWRYSWTEKRDQALDSALNLALDAIRADPADARGFGELGFVHLYRKEHDAAINAYRRATALNPNDADLLSDMADALAHSRQSEEAIELLKKAMRLNPYYPDQYLWHLGGAYFDLKQYDDVIHTIQKMQNPTEGRRLLAASYGHLGRIKEAREQASKVLEAHPEFNVEQWAAVVPDKYEEDAAHFVEGLRKAGL
jgi:TolB-like protein/class 3 adenylate cyclase